MGKGLRKRITAGLTSLLMIPSAAATAALAEGPVLTGDLNGDGTVNVSDALLLSSYLLGRTEFTREQYAISDIDSDGSTDSMDLVALKYIVIANSGRIPKGTWIASDGMYSRYFWFGDGEGNVINESTGETFPFTLDLKDGLFEFAFDTKAENATVSWINRDSFSVVWSDGSMETMRRYSDEPLDYSELLSGDWTGSRCDYSIKGVNGSYLDKGSNIGTSFWYEKKGNDLVFHKGGQEETSHAVMTAVDSMHIDLAWDDGTSERLTKHNVEVKDGITYINGILIANKTYDLPSTYNPGGILPEAQAAFNEMKAAAWNSSRLTLNICSGFRSYAYQRDLYNSYVNRDGKAKADTYSARPGHSEHQTGLAMDINLAGSAFDNTPEAKWIAAHCAEYGFIIRYPQGKQDITGYKYESWHVRYLGKELAKEVTDSGLTLEEFLGIDSVYKY